MPHCLRQFFKTYLQTHLGYELDKSGLEGGGSTMPRKALENQSRGQGVLQRLKRAVSRDVTGKPTTFDCWCDKQE